MEPDNIWKVEKQTVSHYRYRCKQEGSLSCHRLGQNAYSTAASCFHRWHRRPPATASLILTVGHSMPDRFAGSRRGPPRRLTASSTARPEVEDHRHHRAGAVGDEEHGGLPTVERRSGHSPEEASQPPLRRCGGGLS
ncbi:hypothetical protein JZ751_009163 [Albula glossodonta]|uniref:Uncharacterized protein n=1 Tax=Albula glossodonta TaxID=121402 RepID=A0A8T2N669_9TELE|nr:hypothetical protein JZ751_009163 [Albula glossodonta]